MIATHDTSMIDLLIITNNTELAMRCDQIEGMRVFVDLERNGKAERQKCLDSFISTHQIDDVGRIKGVLKRSALMVRVNPFQSHKPEDSKAEVEEVLAQGADLLMLPMFTEPQQLKAFCEMVDGRAPVVALLETAGALNSFPGWLGIPGVEEVFVGLNDLHLSLGCRFMFEPLLQGHVDRVALGAAKKGMRFGFGGIARMDEGVITGRDILAEHLRLGSRAVILSRTFNRLEGHQSFEQAIMALRQAEAQLALRTRFQVQEDSRRIAGLITALVQSPGTRQ